MTKSVGVEPSLPRTATCWSRYPNNVPGKDSETYYRRSIAIPVINDLITNFQDGISDRNHTEIFALLPSICLSSYFDIEQSSAKLFLTHFLPMFHLRINQVAGFYQQNVLKTPVGQ